MLYRIQACPLHGLYCPFSCSIFNFLRVFVCVYMHMCAKVYFILVHTHTHTPNTHTKYSHQTLTTHTGLKTPFSAWKQMDCGHKLLAADMLYLLLTTHTYTGLKTPLSAWKHMDCGRKPWHDWSACRIGKGVCVRARAPLCVCVFLCVYVCSIYSSMRTHTCTCASVSE